MSHLELRNVSKNYGDTEVLSNINLSIEEGEFVALIGFSGSGKTTLISILAGLISPDGGEVRLRGVPAGGAGPDRGVVFQSYSLMPWLSVFENVALAVDTVFAKEAARSAARERRNTFAWSASAMRWIAIPPSSRVACASVSPWRVRWP